MSKRMRSWQKAIFVGVIVFSLLPVAARADSGPAHQVDQPFPIQLGTS